MLATRQELACFAGEAKHRIILADFYYEIEQWKEASNRYQAINRDMRGKLNKGARAYVDFMLAKTSLSLGDKDAAAAHLEGFKNIYRDTPTWPRAMFSYMDIYQTMPDAEESVVSVLNKIHRKMPDTEYGRRAKYHKAEFLFIRGKTSEAREIFLACLDDYRGTWLARGAQQYLDIIQKGEQQ